MTSPTVRVSAAGFLLAAAVACTSNAEPDPPATSPPVSTAQPSPSPSAGNGAIAAYEGMWDAVVDASRDASSDHPELDKYATGDAAALMRQGMESVESSHVGKPSHDLTVKSAKPNANPSRVELRDCQDGSEWRPKGDPPSDQKDIRVDATVVKDALSWKVSALRIWGPGTC
ncbi:hypothetical protein CLV63_11254 [Murinocardiopsis flavida]|uniref:Secreted protein/lipoprotein n=1 Tax=Murinocardiopsis flavida TaxID=645275 RepID=A0A2P8DG33_9ACTN|nr:hypothetical protein [Murinocardiopsis flavida]PSK96172.1 hypothetical protein CLV63_11254 [Murinocardiopsis flavida]